MYAACADFLDSGDTTELEQVENLPDDIKAALCVLCSVVQRTYASYHDLFTRELVWRLF